MVAVASRADEAGGRVVALNTLNGEKMMTTYAVLEAVNCRVLTATFSSTDYFTT